MPPNPAVHGNKEIICRYMVESFKLYSSQIVLLYDINVNWDSCVNWNILYWRLFLKTIRYKQSWQGMNKETEWFWESRCLDSLQCCQHRSFKLYSSQIVLLYDINVNWDSCVNWNILYWRLFLKTIRYKQSWQGMNKETEWFWESRCLDSLQCCQHRSSTHLKPSTGVESVARRRPLQTGSPSRPPPSVYEWSTFHSPEIKLHGYAW